MVQCYCLEGAIVLFIKTTKANGYEYVKLVESYREGRSTKHRVLYNFGRADIIRGDKCFINVVKRLCEIAEMPLKEPGKTALSDCSEATLYNYGYLAYRKLWRKLGIEECMEDQGICYHIEYSLSNAVFLMAIQHLLEPRSKLSTFAHQSRYFNMDKIPLHQLYRALDVLSERKEDIERDLFDYNYVRLNKKVDVVFYDVTTFAFESIAVDGLRNFGYSKDCKFNEVQVVLGMIIDAEGIPVGYELFPGNTFDGKTMVKALENIKIRFGIQRVIIVADRGLNNKMNLHLIAEAGYGYIMASKIRGMNKTMQAKILDNTGFVVANDDSGNEVFRYKTLKYTNVYKNDEGEKHSHSENLVISYSLKRAKKDKKDRERLIEKAKALLEEPEKIKSFNKRGYKKYINQTDPEKPVTWELALEKITQEARFDGYYGIQTSEKSMAPVDIMDAYHTLWKIEESFRVMKSTLEVRPVYHWTQKRIEGHFVVCYLAFMMERTLENLIKNERDEILSSPNRIQEALNTMQLASVCANSEELFIKAKNDLLCNKIFKILKIDLPRNISSKDDLIARFKLEEARLPTQMTFLNPEF